MDVKKPKKEDLQKNVLNINDAKESVKNIDSLKEISDSLERFVSKMLLENIDNKEKAYSESKKIMDRKEAKKLFYIGKRDDNSKNIRGFINGLEYIIFGSHNIFGK